MYEAIYVWPDGTWVYQHEHCDHEDRWRGDDFEVVTASDPRYFELTGMCEDEGCDHQGKPHFCNVKDGKSN